MLSERILLSVRSGHAVAHPALGKDPGRTGGVVAQLLAENLDEGAYELPIAAAPCTPDLAQKGSVGQHLSGVAREYAQQVVLSGGESDQSAGQRHPAFPVVDGQIAEQEPFGPRSSPQGCTDSCREFSRRERLDDIVVSAGFERSRDRFVPSICRNEDDRQIGQLRNALHNLDAVGPRGASGQAGPVGALLPGGCGTAPPGH